MNYVPVSRRHRLARLVAPIAGLFLLGGAGFGIAQAHDFSGRDHSSVNVHRHLPIRHGHARYRHHERGYGHHRYRNGDYDPRRGWRGHRHAYDRHYYRGFRDHHYARRGWRDHEPSFFGRW